MILNYIWVAFFLIGFIVALFRVGAYYFQSHFDWFSGTAYSIADRDVFSAMVEAILNMAKSSVDFSIVLIGIMTFWLGIMKIGEKGGAVRILSKITAPFFTRIFPEIPKDHPAMGSILMNFCANMLGLDNAATPFGLKAMKDLQDINPQPERASNAQIMFLVLNTSGLTLIPVSIIAFRAGAHSAAPAEIFLPILLATFCAMLTGLIAVSIVQRINLFNKVILAYIGGLVLFIVGLFWALHGLEKDKIEVISKVAGNLILLSVIIFFFILGLRSRLNLYESFIEGAKEGFGVAIKIIPYLVAMLVAIGVFRASGAFDWLVHEIGSFFAFLGFDTRFVDALPVAFMKPLSGSGARGMMLEIFNNPAFGPDSFAGRMASVFQGTTETTFYIVAVYFGAVNISKTRYTVPLGLIADLGGIIAAIFITYFFFG
jgi:spore maturation protein SpmA